MVSFEIHAEGSDEGINVAYYAYIKRDEDSLYLDRDDHTFKEFADLNDGKYEFTEDEDQPGVWHLNVDLGSRSGTFSMYPRDERDDSLLRDQTEKFYILDGERLLDPRTEQAALYEHYSGYNSFQLLDEEGDPVEGAQVTVYRKVDYDNKEYDRILGRSETDAWGHWVHPVYVPVGDTYVIVYYKQGVLSTTTTEAVVP